MRRLILLLIALVAGAGSAHAVPDTVSLQVADVTTSSFALIWMTNVAATPAIELYDDPSMARRIDSGLSITPMAGATPEIAAAARSKGIMKIRVAGLSPGAKYYARSVTADPDDPASVGYSPLQQVRTAALSAPYIRSADGALAAFSNDLLSFPVYVTPGVEGGRAELGDLLILSSPASPHPVTSFVGAGTVTAEGILDLNNLYADNGESLELRGSEKAVLTVYRGERLSTLLHYRWLPQNSGAVAVQEPVKGFFADVNLDGRVDYADFEAFSLHFRSAPGDTLYNPDFNFVEGPDAKVDARDFGRFAHEYGRVDVR